MKNLHIQRSELPSTPQDRKLILDLIPKVCLGHTSKIGRSVWYMFLKFFVVSVFLQKLVVSFRSSLLSIIIDTFNIARQDRKQGHIRAPDDRQQAEQQSATPQPQDQVNFNQEYQAWRKQFETHIREDSESKTLTYSPAPSFLLHENSGCIHCNQHIIAFSNALQDFYSKANLSDEDFNKDRMCYISNHTHFAFLSFTTLWRGYDLGGCC
ncbi:hypothetical protein KCU64_g2296, partial [Aureobasidium melanogenum]